MPVKFDSVLLGKPSHDALIKLQDYEIKLLEVIKKTLSSRVKCDKEYAQSLTQIALQSSKIDVPVYDSPVYKAWAEIVHELSQAGQCIKRNAEALQSSTYDKVVGLIKDKVAIKKNYAENRERIDNELLKEIHTELDKKRNLYMKMECEVFNAHQNYDQAITKKGKISGIEKAQDKYRKTTMKLHNYHNDYVLQVVEAQMHQQHYRSSVLPQLLDGLQEMEKQYVESLKDIINEYLYHTSPCREEFVSCHKGAEEKVRNIDPNSEYQSFMESHRTNLEAQASIEFESLSGEGMDLPQGLILMNSLSLQGIEHLARGYQDDLEVVQCQIDDLNQNLNDLDEEIRQFQQNIGNISLMMKQLEYVNTKLKLSENEHLLLKQQQLHYLLNQSLKELGDQAPPLGLVLPELDTVSSASSTDIRSPVGDGKGKGFGFGLGKKILTLKNSIPNVRAFKFDGNTSKAPSLFDPAKDIRQQVWFHGSIPRVEAIRLIANEGDFLLRESTNAVGEFVLTARSQIGAQGIHHFKLPHSSSGFRFEGEYFDSIFSLIHHHYSNKIVVTSKTGCHLINPICKDKWQLSHDDIEMHEKLGSGNFGTVYRGLMRSTNVWVAVKTCKETLDSSTKDKFLMEARILKGYDHPNIVKLIGVCTDKQPIYIIMELVPGGDLSDYVKSQQTSLTQNHLVQLCRDACAGLAYLEEKKCIHRDVAARNCLVSEYSVVKITDFGMSREEEDGVYTVSGNMKAIPMRWTAPEAMNYGQFTSASDVWSFGILSWEIFSFGKQPYPGLTNAQARDRVAEGYRMPKQSNCPHHYYHDVMLLCWQSDPDRRPHFSNLLRTIESLLKTI